MPPGNSSRPRSFAPEQADNDGDDEKHQEDEEQNLGDIGGRGGDATETEDGRHDGDDQEDGGPIEHSLLRRQILSIRWDMASPTVDSKPCQGTLRD